MKTLMTILKGIGITYVVLLVLFAATNNQQGLHQLASLAKNTWNGAAYVLSIL